MAPSPPWGREVWAAGSGGGDRPLATDRPGGGAQYRALALGSGGDGVVSLDHRETAAPGRGHRLAGQDDDDPRGAGGAAGDRARLDAPIGQLLFPARMA